MAITRVQGSAKLEAATGTSLSWTPTTAPTVGNLLTCRIVGWRGSGISFSASDVHDSSGTPKNFNLDIQRVQGGSGNSGSAIFSLIVPSGLTTPLVASFPSGDTRVIVFDEWTGNVTSSVLDTTNSNNDGGTASSSMSSGAINTGSAAGLILATTSFNITSSASGITTTGTNFTQDIVEQDSNTYEGASCDSRLTSTASQTGVQDTWTASGGTAQWGATIASYNAASGGGGGSGLAPSLLVARSRDLWNTLRKWWAIK